MVKISGATEDITDKYTVETLKRDAYGRPRQSQLALDSTHHWNTSCQLHELHPECTRLNSEALSSLLKAFRNKAFKNDAVLARR